MANTRQDHFYACVGHLKDKGFASPIIDAKEAAEKKKKEELDREIELIKKEHEERMKKKSKNKRDKKEDSKEKDKKDEKEEEDEDAKAEKEKDDKVSHQRLQPNYDICSPANPIKDQRRHQQRRNKRFNSRKR